MTIKEQFTALIQKINAYEEATSVMYWDLRTGAPKKGWANVPKQSAYYQRKLSK